MAIMPSIIMVLGLILILLGLLYSFERAAFQTGTALDTLVLIDGEGRFYLSAYSSHRTVSCALGAAFAEICIDVDLL